MSEVHGYVLGQSSEAARRLAIQDAHFADVSEQLLDELALRPTDRVVELGCGAGSFSRRVLQRLGAGGVLIGVDYSEGLLTQARDALAGMGPARFETVSADIAALGSWLDGADVVVARTVLHHIPMAEFMVGRLLARLGKGKRLGFLEPDFRTPLVHLAHLESTTRPELTPLLVWATAINQLYAAKRISPAIGATFAETLKAVGCTNVRSEWKVSRSDGTMIENMLMFYDEVQDKLHSFGILSPEEVERQKKLLRALSEQSLPGVWGIHRITATT
jgi:trans-aconitate methyltransferase